MIVPYLPLIFLMVVIFTQPHVSRCLDRSATGGTFATRDVGCTGRKPVAVSPRGARTPAPVARDASLQKPAVPLPAARPPVGSARTIPNQVTAAMTVAWRLTAASSAAARNTIAPPLVLLVMVRREIASASDLAGKAVAIDAAQPPMNEQVRITLNRAGAADVKLTSGRTRAVDRLTKGEVTAAVLGLVSPDAAEGFPEVDGFRIIRIPQAR